MRIDQKEKLIALALAGVVFWWGATGLNNLGFSLLNSIFWIAIFYKYPHLKKDRTARIWAGLSLGLGWMVAIRAYELVKLLTVVSVFILNSMAAARGGELKSEITIEKIIGTTLYTWAKTLREIIEGVSGFKIKVDKNRVPVGKGVLGLIMGIPLVMLFGGLLYSADPIFAKLIGTIKLPKIEINPEIIMRLVVATWFFGQALAMVRTKFMRARFWNIEIKQITETNIAVGMVEILFFVFSVVQLRYWNVGGEELRAMGISYSEYTRAGYFQLIVTSLLAWVIVLGLDQSLVWQKKLKVNQEKLTKVMGTMILAHIGLFVMVAVKRNLLYLGTYGFTRVRLLGMALAIWIVVVAIMTLVKLWKNKSQDYLGKALILISAVAIFGLNVANIDRMIIKYRPASLPTGIDYPYLANLSDDAWEGWEEIISQQEKLANSGNFNIEKLSELRRIKYAFEEKAKRLDWHLKNNWQYLGSWNLASWQSKNEIEKNKVIQRLEKIVGNSEKKINDIFVAENAEKVRAQANQLVNYLISMKRGWSVNYPYNSDITNAGFRTEIAIETTGEMDGKLFSEMTAAISQQGGKICQWNNSFLNNLNKKYTTIIVCEIKSGR